MYKQIALPGEQETLINIDYEDKTLSIYTNRATVMNRIAKLGHKPSRVDKVDGEVWALEFSFTTKDIGKFLRTGIFKFD